MNFKEWLLEFGDNRILFYHRDRAQYGFLSNFHPASFQLDGHTWSSVEQYYMAMKSDHPEYRQQIMDAPTPGKMKRLGDSRIGHEKQSTQSLFHPKKGGIYQLQPNWDNAKLEVMFKGVYAKFSQNPSLGQALKATGGMDLVEDSPTDNFWGTGDDGSGKNWLGKILMRVRDQI